ncbi:hypothetical protein K438DRAFT_1852847, partial [Mycena galopus ATCC 62051]
HAPFLAFHLTPFVSTSLFFSNHLLSLLLGTRFHASACLSHFTISISICFHSVLLPFLDSAALFLASLALLRELFRSI